MDEITPAKFKARLPNLLKSRNLCIYFFVACCVFLAAVWLTGSALSSPAPNRVGNLPDDLTGRDVEFASKSGATLRGWFVPGRKGAGAVILMHGLRASRLNMLGRTRFLAESGFTVLCFDFRAHGESTGDEITFGYLESEDARAAIEFLRHAAPDERIGIIGISMGGAATLLATPPLAADALVLEEVYATIGEALTNRLTANLGGWASVLSNLLIIQFEPRVGVNAEELRPIERVEKLTMPKLFIVGAADKYTTLEESVRLYERAAKPKEFWAIEGAAHVCLHSFATREYEQRVKVFFEKNLR
jgi:pimeloyl-ACP methyl ester carboxylesterase